MKDSRCVWVPALLLLVAGGCANIRITDPSRTATEQFLLTGAAQQAVDPLTFEALHGRTVFVDGPGLGVVEKEFVLSLVRSKLLESGVLLAGTREEAQVLFELRSGGVGIDRYESLAGIPSLLAPAAATSAASGTPTANLILPELAISKTIKQVAFASISYVAYWRETGEIVAFGGPSIGRTYREDWWFLGTGPHTVGNVPTVDHKIEE